MTEGAGNTAMGYYCLSQCTTGDNNIAIGNSAASTGIVTGDENIMIGTNAGNALTSGGSNIKAILENSIQRSSGTAGGDGVQTESDEIKLKLAWLDGSTPRFITFVTYITGITMGASMGEVSSVDITWEANGAPIEDALATGSASSGS